MKSTDLHTGLNVMLKATNLKAVMNDYNFKAVGTYKDKNVSLSIELYSIFENLLKGHASFEADMYVNDVRILHERIYIEDQLMVLDYCRQLIKKAMNNESNLGQKYYDEIIG